MTDEQFEELIDQIVGTRLGIQERSTDNMEFFVAQHFEKQLLPLHGIFRQISWSNIWLFIIAVAVVVDVVHGW